MMAQPTDTEDDEGKGEQEQLRPHLQQGMQQSRIIVRCDWRKVQIDNQQRDGDPKHAIAKRHQPISLEKFRRAWGGHGLVLVVYCVSQPLGERSRSRDR